ncbi:MAG: hypothetical protein A4E61_00396 [Syntrophorhabdus sp. PtaB.Bin184]|nr:MAG: hypothetical protein A4E61_00396 [Syntrophorhabdus sp. PtaB.Bin184]
MKKYIALSMREYPEDFLYNRDLKRERLSELSANITMLSRQITAVERAIRWKHPCSPEMFQDSKFMTAERKKKTLRQWDTFIKGGFSSHLFTQAIYYHLHQHCRFIAHYNRMGFYSTYWNDDFVAFVKRTGMVVRPVPEAFVNWEEFLFTFDCLGEWVDMSATMLYSLKTHLSSTLRELKDEVVDTFHHDVERLYPLHLEERKRLAAEADEYRKKVVELTTKLDDMDIDSFLEEQSAYYKELFPSLDPADFAEAGMVSNLC